MPRDPFANYDIWLQTGAGGPFDDKEPMENEEGEEDVPEWDDDYDPRDTLDYDPDE